MPKTADEIYKYVLDYKNGLKDTYNADQDKHFAKSNDLKMKLSNQMIVFSSLLLSIGIGYLLSKEIPSKSLRIILASAILSYAVSTVFGLLNTHTAAEFYLKWASNAHEKGGMVYKDRSKTVEELEKLLSKLSAKDKELPPRSSKLPFIAQTAFFALGITLILAAMLLIVF